MRCKWDAALGKMESRVCGGGAEPEPERAELALYASAPLGGGGGFTTTGRRVWVVTRGPCFLLGCGGGAKVASLRGGGRKDATRRQTT